MTNTIWSFSYIKEKSTRFDLFIYAVKFNNGLGDSFSNVKVNIQSQIDKFFSSVKTILEFNYGAQLANEIVDKLTQEENLSVFDEYSIDMYSERNIYGHLNANPTSMVNVKQQKTNPYDFND